MSKREAALSAAEPIIRLVKKILRDAVAQGASDIHVRPNEEDVELLYRIDGTLIRQRLFSRTLLNAIVIRIKILGKMDIAERRLPQDGRSIIENDGNDVDLRISVIPTINGESVVIRLLDSSISLRAVSELGFNQHDEDVFRDMLHRSYGMILVTGPTGSGKSTTLYAALKEVMDQNVNIVTVEDPVEYHIDGIEQIQVNTVPGYTFARALRHILRHDPDVIMIGEIRDEETAKIAIESSLTGHLVLSTLHTNNSVAAIIRLLEMDVDPYLLNGTLLGVLAQRLAKRNCKECLEPEPVDPQMRKFLQVAEQETFYHGTGCPACNGTGHKGRIAVYELLRITTKLKELIKRGATEDELHSLALEQGMTSLTHNALERAREQVISLAEVYRVRLE